MSSTETFSSTAIQIAQTIRATSAFNTVIAFPRGVDGREVLTQALTTDAGVAPFVLVTESLDRDTLEFALEMIAIDTFPLVLIDDTSYAIDRSLFAAVTKAIHRERKGFIILSKPMHLSGFEGLVEVVLKDQTAY